MCFVRSHSVILPETLFYECYTNNKLSDKGFLKRLYQLLKTGAYVSYQLMEIIKDEGENLSPCKCIINHSETNNLRVIGFREEKSIGKTEIDKTKKDRSKIAHGVKKLASKTAQMLINNPDYLREIRSLNLNRNELFQKWIEIAEKNDIHDLACESFRKYVKDSKKYCLSTDWISWHYMRLIYVIALEYSYLQITATCPKDEFAEHDTMDIEYITFLAKCEGLLTRDAKLRKLAEIAFPNKNVYSNVQDIGGQQQNSTV